MTLEPAGKLDAEATLTAATAAGRVVPVNGPQDDDLDWDAINWRSAENDVRRVAEHNAGRAGPAISAVSTPTGLA